VTDEDACVVAETLPLDEKPTKAICLDFDALKHEKERKHLMIAVFILALVIVPTVMTFAYPRTDLEVKVWYMEGFLGSFNVDVELRNLGTREVEDMTVHMKVYNSSGVVIAEPPAYEDVVIRPFGRQGLPNMQLMGDAMGNDTHYSTFTIVVELQFRCMGKDYDTTHEFVTEEPYLSQIFTDEVKDWAGF